MKIGILTFHWATNYGAVLQTYATQTVLKALGHEPTVINYKPTFYDFSLKSVLRELKNGRLKEYIVSLKKEVSLEAFRKKYLNQSNRVATYKEIPDVCSDLDCIISGSDQVFNSAFLTFGEGIHEITPSYYLGFKFSGKRVGYAVSFGVVNFPSYETELVKPFVAKFDKIGTREASGAKIIETMERADAVVVPDPTILLSPSEYRRLAESIVLKRKATTYCFFIRHISERKTALSSLLQNEKILWNNDDGDYSLEGWLAKIKNVQFVITDSFHCMVMCLKLHTPFVVVTELQGNQGMNDRLYTLLGILDLLDRIVYKGNVTSINSLKDSNINWILVDQKLDEYKAIGVDFLKSM